MCAIGRRYLALQGYASMVVSLTCGQGALVVSLGSVMIDQLQQQRPGAFGAIPASCEQLTWSVSLYFAGVMMGSLAAGWLGQRYGARNVTMVSSLMVVVFWTFLALSVNIGMVLAGRFALGFYFGVASPCSGVFISGVTSSRYRGLSTFSLEINAAIFAIIAFLLSKLLPWWQVALLVGVPSGLLTLLALLPLPSDPVWLVSRGRLEEASGSLAFYRGPDTDLWLLRMWPEGGNSCWRSLRQLQRRPYWLPTLLCAVQLLMFVWCGGSTLQYYTVVLVRDLGLPLDPLLASALIVLCRLPLSCLSACLVDGYGRRALLLVSSAGMFVCHGTLALLQFLPPSSAIGPPLSLAALMACTAMFAFGNSPLTWTLLAELLPPDVRQMYASLLMVFWGGMSLLQVQSFPHMLRAAGLGVMFSLWAAVSLLHVIFVLRFLPETSRLTNSQLDQLFTKRPDRGAPIVNTILCTDAPKVEKQDPLELPPLYLPI